MQRNTIQNQNLKILFDTVADHKKISEEKCLEFKTLLKTLLKSACEEMEPMAAPETAIIDTQDGLFHNTLLMHASMNGHFEIVRQLIKEKASLNIKNDEGVTALIFAVGYEQLGIVNELLVAKAALEIKNNIGNSALDVAIHNDNLSIAILLLKQGAVIRNAKALLDILENQDARDPNVISILEELCKGQQDILHDYSSFQYYLEKLKALEKFQILYKERKNTIDTTLNAINEAKGKMGTMTKDLVNLITCYNHPPLAKLPFFKVKDLDIIMPGKSLSTYEILNGKEAMRLLDTLKQIGRDYLENHPSANYYNFKAATLLRDLSLEEHATYGESELARFILDCSKFIFNLAKSELLKNQIKNNLSTCARFSLTDLDKYFSENAMTDEPDDNVTNQQWSALSTSIKPYR
jgi:hypothetical protein